MLTIVGSASRTKQNKSQMHWQPCMHFIRSINTSVLAKTSLQAHMTASKAPKTTNNLENSMSQLSTLLKNVYVLLTIQGTP